MTHPTTILEFESVYRKEYEYELKSCDDWIKWCEQHGDTHSMNFHQGLRSALVFNNIKIEQLLRVLKQQPPNARPGELGKRCPKCGHDEIPCAEPAEDLLKSGAARIEQLETALGKIVEIIDSYDRLKTKREQVWEIQMLIKKALADGEPKSK